MIKTQKLFEFFSYVDIALRMYFCCPSSNRSADKSFFALMSVE